MPTAPLASAPHAHDFHSTSSAAERGTRVVLVITLITMVLEIAAGTWSGSMALLADGWHMGSHAVAIGMTVLAYAASRRYAADARFAFGTWKIEVLGGYTSALLLLGVGLFMLWESGTRLLAPQPIQYREAIAVAVLGLLVNLGCAAVLTRAGHHHHHGHDHDHDHDHGHSHDHDHPHHDAHAHAPHGEDLNLRSATVHVLADAATSVLAIAALCGGWLYGWSWLDPVMGLAGAVLVMRWSVGLLKDTSAVLLDREMHHPIVDEIRQAVQRPGDPQRAELVDLHVWRVAPRAYTVAMSVATQDTRLTPDALRERLGVHPEIVHSTIEVLHR